MYQHIYFFQVRYTKF